MWSQGLKPEQKSRHLVVVAIICVTLLSVLVWFNVAERYPIAVDLFGDGQYGPHFECNANFAVQGFPLVHTTISEHYPGKQITTRSGAAACTNLALAIISIVIAWRWLGRRLRIRGLQLNVRELLVASIAIGVLIGLITQRYRLHSRQVEFLRETQLDAEWHWFDPLGIRRSADDPIWTWGDVIVSLGDFSDVRQLASVPGKDHIRVLRIHGFYFEDLHVLAEFDHLEAIDFMMVGYGSKGGDPNDDPEFLKCIPYLMKCRSLVGLNLYEAGLTDADLAALSQLQDLQNMNLAPNYEITDSGLKHLHRLQSLRKLSLKKTDLVSNEAISDLQKALPECEVNVYR